VPAKPTPSGKIAAVPSGKISAAPGKISAPVAAASSAAQAPAETQFDATQPASGLEVILGAAAAVVTLLSLGVQLWTMSTF
jgi:hypothetical protein